MSKEINFREVLPAAYEAMDALDKFVEDSSIGKLQKELIKIRASQLNGCAYCVDSHDALKYGELLQKVLLVSAWREAGDIFTEEERLIFKITEEVTLIHKDGLIGNTYDKAIELFGPKMTAEIVMNIITINAWNRIGVATELKPAPRKKVQLEELPS